MSSVRAFMGIDPGKNGGIAVVTAAGTVSCCPMPHTEFGVWDFVRDWGGNPGVVKCVLERVSSRPGEGVVSTFTFGVGYGGLRMALIAAGVDFTTETPRDWMKEFSVPARKSGEKKSAHKNRLKAKAVELFPGVKVTLQTCDAILLAEFCRRRYS